MNGTVLNVCEINETFPIGKVLFYLTHEGVVACLQTVW